VNVYKFFDEIPVTTEKVILAIGKFDGVHKGHNAVLEKIFEKCKIREGRPWILTFSRTPAEFFQKGKKHLRLMTLEHKLYMLEKKGIDTVILIDFSEKFANINADVFVNLLRNKILNFDLVVGFDFRLGKNSAMDAEALRQKGYESNFTVDIVPPFIANSLKISSTRIKALIVEGEIEEANEYLEKPYSIEGKVTSRDNKGKVIGYPTANINNSEVVYPKEGVYLSGFQIAKKTEEGLYPEFDEKIFFGMTYVGKSSLTGTKAPSTIETHIFDFNKNIYGETVRVLFYRRIRNSIKFKSYEELKNQLAIDKVHCLKLIENWRS